MKPTNQETKINIQRDIPDVNKPPKLTISADGYESKEIIPYKGDGTPKNDLGVILLEPTEKALEIDKIKSSQLNKKEINGLTLSKKDANYFVQEKLNKKIIELKTSVIPLLLTLISKFGITKAMELVNKTKDDIEDKLSKSIKCPSKEEIELIIFKKNKLVKIIKNTLKIINITTKTLTITQTLITGFKIAYQTAKNAPIPIPPGTPTNVVLGVQDLKDKLLKKIEFYEKINKNILIVLTLLKSILELILKLLSLLDVLIQSCVQTDQINQTDQIDQTDFSSELAKISLFESNQTSPITTDVNGFTMGVETEPQSSTLSIKRRRATATNKQGVIMLTGEWSFSSIDQILIDELVFYIQTNDLRAD